MTMDSGHAATLLPMATFHSPRDPGGLNPAGIESFMGEDPTGVTTSGPSPSNQVVAGVRPPAPPATPTRTTMPETPVLALLVGVPPPPPSTPPPKKKRRSRSTPRTSNHRERRLSTDSTPLDRIVSPTMEPSASDVVSPKTAKKIEKIARAVYEHADSVPSNDPPTGEHHKGRPAPNEATPVARNQRSAVFDQENNESPTKPPPSPIRLRSPLSITTEPRSNQPEKVPVEEVPPKPASLSKRSQSLPMTEEELVAVQVRHEAVPVPSKNRRSLRPKTPERLRRALSTGHRRGHSEASKDARQLRRRSKTPERRSKTAASRGRTKTPDRRRANTPERQSDPVLVSSFSASSEEEPDDSNKGKGTKKGFFRKLFGKKSKKKPAIERLSDEETHVTSRFGAKETDGWSARIEEQPRDVHYYHSDVAPYASSNETTSRSNADDRASVFFAHDEVSTLTLPTVDTFHRSRDPTEETGKVSEPLGHYWNSMMATRTDDDGFPSIDPFTEPFFHHEPAGLSPIPTDNITPSANKLRVQVPAVHDPVGDSPMNSHNKPSSVTAHHDPSPHGYQTPSFSEHPIQDPLGESPLHKHERGPSALIDGTPYAPDPPLCLLDLDGDQSSMVSGEEKKEEEFSSNIARFSIPPPPPPGPSPRRHARLSPRRPTRSESPTTTESSGKETIMLARSPSPKAKVYVPAPKLAQTSVSSQFSLSSNESSYESGESDDGQISGTKDSGKASKEVSSDEDLNRVKRLGQRPVLDAAQEPSQEEHSASSATTAEESRLDRAKTLETERSIKKSGSGSKSKRSRHLTMSSAARMNAKTVAYIHTLNGDPPPRNAWRKPEVGDEDMTPRTKADSLGAAAFTVAKATKRRNRDASESVSGEASKLFSAYSGKFKGRKLSTGRLVRMDNKSRKAPISKPPATVAKKTKVVSWRQDDPMARDVGISYDAVGLGFALLRGKRESDIASGLAQRAIPVRQPKIPVVQSYFGPYDDQEPKDPIQRAGRRLLSKAAIPVQAAARRFLAQKQAVDRMWALLEIQSYARRWRAEAFLLASSISAIRVQKVFRGWRARSQFTLQRVAAFEIQRMVRGYLSAIHVFEDVYKIILVQAMARAMKARRMQACRISSATVIQSQFRCFVQRAKYQRKRRTIIAIQAQWRCSLIRACFQFVVVDIIIAQSIVRRWMACQRVQQRRDSWKNDCAVKIQTVWRGYKSLNQRRRAHAATRIQCNWRCAQAGQRFRKYRAAKTIQSAWRGFQSYTDYIFALVDVLVVQRTVRRWLASRKVMEVRRHQAAVLIQKSWRRRRAQLCMMYDLVNIIIVQSFARRYLARSSLAQLRQELMDAEVAAVKIQSVWRGFWQYSHYVILRYEAVRIQSAARGMLARSMFIVHLGCIILVQSAARRFLDKKKAAFLRLENAILLSKIQKLREVNACRRIQFFWRVVMDCRKEKEAALVIERFFVMVKKEVDREIQRALERKKERRRKKKPYYDEKLLEHVWLDTVDDSHVDVFAFSKSQSFGNKSDLPTPLSRVDSTPRNETFVGPEISSIMSDLNAAAKEAKNFTQSRTVHHRASSPTMNLVMRHEHEGNVHSSVSSAEKSAAKSLTLNDPLDHTSGNSSVLSAENYLKMHGVITAPSRSSTDQHFFRESDSATTPNALVHKSRPMSTRSESRAQRRKESPSLESKAPSPLIQGRGASLSSPRHSNILVMNLYPDYPARVKDDEVEIVDTEYVGEEFGVI